MDKLIEIYLNFATTNEDREQRENLVDSYLKAMFVATGMAYEKQANDLFAMMKPRQEDTFELVQPETPATTE